MGMAPPGMQGGFRPPPMQGNGGYHGPPPPMHGGGYRGPPPPMAGGFRGPPPMRTFLNMEYNRDYVCRSTGATKSLWTIITYTLSFFWLIGFFVLWTTKS